MLAEGGGDNGWGILLIEVYIIFMMSMHNGIETIKLIIKQLSEGSQFSCFGK
jgi:hypothetical protein